MAKRERKKHPKLRIAVLCVLAVTVIAALVFMRFGGFGTGESADPQELAKYAGTVADIDVPENVTIVALGEATHGNIEFQQLKLIVFKHLVENCGVKAFALEGDYGGCEQVNRYIHGADGTADEAAAAIGFAIYRTPQMAELISYMRQYNETAPQGEDLRFYGFDMQRVAYSFQFLTEACGELGVDTSGLEMLLDGENWSDAYGVDERIDAVTRVKSELELKENSAQAVHFADVLLQNLGFIGDESMSNGDYIIQRDRYMTENTLWIAAREREAGFGRIFVSAHNGHVAKWGSYDQMGKLLEDEIGDDYYCIGTDFYKTCCNMPRGASGRRTNQVFYSHDPLAKAAKRAGLDMCWLDFEKAAKSPELEEYISDYNYLGSLGEGYSLLMRILPPSYREFQPPAGMYNGMIFVSSASPTTILSAK